MKGVNQCLVTRPPSGPKLAGVERLDSDKLHVDNIWIEMWKMEDGTD